MDADSRTAGISMICLGVISLSGVITINTNNKKPAILALCIGISIAGYSIVDKVGVQLVNPIVYIWLMFFLSAIFLAPYIILHYRGSIVGDTKQYFIYALIIGIGSIVTYLMILFAFTLGPVGYIVAVREFAVVVGSLLGIIVLKERVTAIKLTSVSTIVIGMICIRISQYSS